MVLDAILPSTFHFVISEGFSEKKVPVKNCLHLRVNDFHGEVWVMIIGCNLHFRVRCLLLGHTQAGRLMWSNSSLSGMKHLMSIAGDPSSAWIASMRMRLFSISSIL